MLRFKHLAISIVMSGFLLDASAEMSIEVFEQSRNAPQGSIAHSAVNLYVAGLGDAYEWANTFLEGEGLPPLYCTSKTVPLNTNNFIQIITDELKEHRSFHVTRNVPIGMVLLAGLKNLLPCSPRSPRSAQ